MSHVVNWNELAEVSTRPGVTKRTLSGESATVIKITLAAGLESPRHDHPHEQFVYVVSGSGILETEEGRRDFGAGDLFHFPANVWHAATFTAKTVVIETNVT
jgi:quercetin dioxygenase-like cupin family protein